MEFNRRVSLFYLLIFNIVFLCLGQYNNNSTGDGENKQLWKYVSVRPGAHMLWWLYYTTHPSGHQQRPLIIWLQGGPGGSSTGFGNFGELGPLDVKLQPRNSTWLSSASLLFIDNPVGAGFSYTDTDSAFTTDVGQIAADLLTVVKAVVKDVPDFQSVPLYIFSESYGGKMTAVFTKTLYQAAQAGEISVNLQGCALGDSWISSLDYVFTWGPYLYATSILDDHQLALTNETAVKCQAAFDAGDYKRATEIWSDLENQITELTGGVSFYNILDWSGSEVTRSRQIGHKLYYDPYDAKYHRAVDSLFSRHVAGMYGDELDDLMNGPIRKKLGIIPDNVQWGAQSGKVFEKQSEDFMKPVVDVVDWLLNNTDLKVVVYNGQLDLICDTLGTERWLRRLSWPQLPAFTSAKRMPIKVGGQVAAYRKSLGQLSFYWILDAGHMVPADNGDAALAMVNMVIDE